MSISCGKKARKSGGTRAAVKRASKRANMAKVFQNNAMSPQAYQTMKLSEKKKLKSKGR